MIGFREDKNMKCNIHFKKLVIYLVWVDFNKNENIHDFFFDYLRTKRLSILVLDLYAGTLLA